MCVRACKCASVCCTADLAPAGTARNAVCDLWGGHVCVRTCKCASVCCTADLAPAGTARQIVFVVHGGACVRVCAL